MLTKKTIIKKNSIKKNQKRILNCNDTLTIKTLFNTQNFLKIMFFNKRNKIKIKKNIIDFKTTTNIIFDFFKFKCRLIFI